MTLSGEPFSLLIKPASADCNLECAYCFYRDRVGPHPGNERRMSGRVLTRLISGFLETPQTQHVFAWQGGEPTLMGVDFFEEVVTLQRKYSPAGGKVANCLQTNAQLIDDEFAGFFARNGFLLGVSLDGPLAMHDRYRKRGDGVGSHAAAMKGIECLKRHGVEFNIAILVSKANVKKSREVYRFLRENGCDYHQYIECVEFDESGCIQPYSISAEEWGDFLCGIFDEWVEADAGRVSVRLFDAVLACLIGEGPAICSMGHACGRYVVVEFNGDAYPCDFYVRKDLRIGNIETNEWKEIRGSPIFASFAAQKSDWSASCASCPYLPLCQGDCLKNRTPAANHPRTLSFLCQGWKKFYDHSLPKFMELAGQVAHNRNGSQYGQQ